MPQEVLFNIFHRLDPKDKKAVAGVNQQVKYSSDDNLLWKKQLDHSFPYLVQPYDEKIVYKNLFEKTERRHYTEQSKSARSYYFEPKLVALFKVVREGDFSDDALKKHNIIGYDSFLTQILTNLPDLIDRLGHSLVSAIQDQNLLNIIYTEKTKNLNNKREKILWACRCNQLEIIDDFMTNGVDTNHKLPGSEYPLVCASENGRLAVMERLFTYSGPTSTNTMLTGDILDAFKKTFAIGRLDVVQKLFLLVDDAVKQSIFIENDFELFRLACKGGHVDIVELCLKQVTHIQKQEMIASVNFEAIKLAAEGGYMRITGKLLSEIDDIDIRNDLSIFHLEAHNNREIPCMIDLVDHRFEIFHKIRDLIQACNNSNLPAQDKQEISNATISLISNFPLYSSEELNAYDNLAKKNYRPRYKKIGLAMFGLSVGECHL